MKLLQKMADSSGTKGICCLIKVLQNEKSVSYFYLKLKGLFG